MQSRKDFWGEFCVCVCQYMYIVFLYVNCVISEKPWGVTPVRLTGLKANQNTQEVKKNAISQDKSKQRAIV